MDKDNINKMQKFEELLKKDNQVKFKKDKYNGKIYSGR